MNTFLKILIIGIIFALGFFSSNIYADLNIENPDQFGLVDVKESPNDWIKESQILVYNSQVILDLKNAEWATFTDTHSMEPVLSSRANAIEIRPKSVDDIKVGDIISYKSEYADGTIIHRVIEKNEDEQGAYFILKGDNNPSPDPGKIRFEQIQRVVVAIVY
ncbi:TPA: signal peptidase I [Candidatus Woesearchaeota archaeon]|nr:signal peptidase I [Candidatus Woesearchaeota archaeon]